jgi:agmatine/peptidylarginine deiminase
MNTESANERSFVRKIHLSEESVALAFEAYTPAERVLMVWPITQDCWAFVPGYDAQQEFQRHVVRVERREG